MLSQTGNLKPTKMITIDRSLSKGVMVDLLLPAVLALKQGGHVVFPTETVYGLCCDPANEDAMKELYAIKGRDFRNPLTLHLSGTNHVLPYVQGFDRSDVQKLVSVFWPGPLTLVLPKTENVLTSLTGGLSTVGLRYPSDPVAQAFIESFGGVVAGTSANRSGHMAITSHRDLEQSLVGCVDCIISADYVGGLESTVLDMTEGAKILRPGLISAEMIEEILGYPPELCYAQSPTANAKKYALETPLKLYDAENLSELLPAFRGKVVGIVVFDEVEADSDWDKLRNQFGILEFRIESLKYQKYAALLYDTLHRLDHNGVDVIMAPKVEKVGVGAAVMHRLEKSAGLI